MSLAPRRALSTIGWMGLGLICFAVGCSKSDESAKEPQQPKYRVAQEDGGETPGGDALSGAGGSGGPTQPPSLSIDQLETITVPDGTPEELLEFASQMGDKFVDLQTKTGGRMTGADKTRAIELFKAINTSSDKILALNEATLTDRKSAIDIKSGAMSWLSQLEPETNWSGKIREFAVTLAGDKNLEIAVQGKSILFAIYVGEISQGRSKDLDGLMNQLRALLQEEARAEVVMSVALQAMNVFLSLGHEDRAREALDLIVAAFKDSENPALAQEAANLTEQAMFLDSDMEPKFNATVANREGAAQVFVDELQKILDQPSPGQLTFGKSATYIDVLQQTGHYDLAGRLCEMVEVTYAKISQEQLKQQAAGLMQMARRRLELVGKPLVVEGRRLDGLSLDFTHYQGKVVLVVFFTVFAQGCQQELVDISTIYQTYHEQGFEVIGVSIDPNPDALKEFLSQVSLPWMTVMGAELAEKCGVTMCPFGVLLDRTGKVTDIFVQGRAISQKVEALLGPSETAKPPANSVSPPGGQSRSKLLRRIHRHDSGFVALEGAETDFIGASATGPHAVAVVDSDPQEDEADELELNEAEEAVNPYLARPGLAPAQLVDFLLDMQEKPKSIRRRPGFAEALVDAADRVMRSDAKAKYQLIAAETKLDVLHEVACLGDEKADQQLSAFVQELGKDKRSEIVRRVEFFQLERRALEAGQLDLQKIPGLLADLQRFFEGQAKLETRHLRIASAAVHAVNRLEKDAQREEYFTQLGSLFMKSEDRQLARYGKKLATGGKGRASDLIGKPLELEGITDLGVPLDWSSYRGRVVLVDFWATWCGPCLREMPNVRSLYEELSADGFDVVAVSLDEDMEALAKFLQEKKLPWTNLVGERARELAVKYQVHGIPTLVLVDKEGKVVAVANKVETLQPQIKKLLSDA